MHKIDLIRVGITQTLLSAVVIATLPMVALAGSVPVVETDSSVTGQGSGFATDAISNFATTSQISTAVSGSLQTSLSQGQVQAGGQTLALSSEQVAAFSAIFSGGAEAEAAADFLVQEISNDIGVDLDISVVEASSDNLTTAVSNINNLVSTLSREQLIQAVQSAPLQATVQALQAAVTATEAPPAGGGGESGGEGSKGGLILLTLP